MYSIMLHDTTQFVLWTLRRTETETKLRQTHLSPSIMSTLEASTPSANQPVCSLDSFRPHTPYWSALKMVWGPTVIIKTSQLIPNKRIAAVFARFCQNVPFITHWFPHRCTRYSGLWVFWRQATPRFSRHSQRERVHVRPQRPQRTIVCCLSAGLHWTFGYPTELWFYI